MEELPNFHKAKMKSEAHFSYVSAFGHCQHSDSSVSNSYIEGDLTCPQIFTKPLCQKVLYLLELG